jgi:hypothetical protein
METTAEKLKKMDEVMKLQIQVAEIAEDNKKKVAALQAKFEKVEAEAYDECPVCYGSISVKNTCCMPNCDHKMCKNCYYNWLDKQEKNTCPMCREEVFKNNLDIKTKRSVLQNHLDSLESEVAEMYHERRHIRKSIRDTECEFAQLDDDITKLYDKHDQLRDEIFDKQQLVDEINEYKRNPEKWRIRKERRLKWDIHKGYRIWREKYHKLKVQLLFEFEFRCHCNNYKEKGYKSEKNRLYTIGKENRKKFDEEVDLSETNMFDEPEKIFKTTTSARFDELALEYRIGEPDPRSEHKFKLEDCLRRIQKYKLYKSAYNYGWRIPTEEVNVYEEDGYETDDTMPALIDANGQEIEDIETTFSEDEREYDRSASNVNPPLEEGEIVEPPPLTRVNRRLNFNYTDSENALERFNSLYDTHLIIDSATREVRTRAWFDDSEFTEWERAYLNGDEDRSIGYVTTRTANV